MKTTRLPQCFPALWPPQQLSPVVWMALDHWRRVRLQFQGAPATPWVPAPLLTGMSNRWRDHTNLCCIHSFESTVGETGWCSGKRLWTVHKTAISPTEDIRYKRTAVTVGQWYITTYTGWNTLWLRFHANEHNVFVASSNMMPRALHWNSSRLSGCWQRRRRSTRARPGCSDVQLSRAHAAQCRDFSAFPSAFPQAPPHFPSKTQQKLPAGLRKHWPVLQVSSRQNAFQFL